MDNAHSFLIMMPEFLLAACGFLLLVLGLADRAKATRVITLLTIFSFLLTGFFVIAPMRLHFFFDGSVPMLAFNYMFVDDAFGRFVKIIILLASSFALLLSGSYLEKENIERPEFPVLVLFATLGMMLMVSAVDMMSLYVGLELQSLSLYVLAAFKRDNAKSSESGLKYFVLGALSSGLILYGISFLYGFAGTTQFGQLAVVMGKTATPSIGIIIGMVFICAAMAFKVSAVPFHMWTPDVYEGAPTPVTAFFAAAPKIAGLALLARLLSEPLGPLSHQWSQIVVFMSIASMVLGSFAGVVQSNIKRLMAYSSIANVGYALAGLALVDKTGIQAMLIYLVIYFVNTLGAFGVILCLRRKGVAAENLSDFAGLAKTNPLLALAMMIFMFSLAAVPPFAGFFGKYIIFLAAVQAHMVPLAIVAVLTSVVAAFYYLRIVKLMYFDEPVGVIDTLPDFGTRAAITVAALYMIVFTLWPSHVIDSAMAAVTSLTH